MSDFKFSDLTFHDHPVACGVQALYKGWSVIKCVGSKGFILGQYEVKDPQGSIHGWLNPLQVELKIKLWEMQDEFHAEDNDVPFDDPIPL